MDVSHSVCSNVVKVFSLNRIISLAGRQAFAHYHLTLQYGREMNQNFHQWEKLKKLTAVSKSLSSS